MNTPVRRILHIASSPRGTAAHSYRAAERLLAQLRHEGDIVVRHDLFADPPPIVDAGFSAAILGADMAAPALGASERLIEALDAADILVISTAMHNFTVPAPLKAWVDQIVRIHRTFRSTPQGKIGVLRDRPAILVVASGGWYTEAAPAGVPLQPDFLTPYLRTVLATIGINDLTVIALEGMARGEEAIARGMARAADAIAAIISGCRPASAGTGRADDRREC